MSPIAPEAPSLSPITRLQVRVGNRDIASADFVWIDAPTIARRATPADAVLLERLEWGNFYGTMTELRAGDQVIATGSEPVWQAFAPLHAQIDAQRRQARALERGPIGDINTEIERLRLARKRLDRENLSPAVHAERAAALAAETAAKESEYEALATRLFALREEILEAGAGDVDRRRRDAARSRWATSSARSGRTRWAAAASCGSTAPACGSSSPASRASRTPRAASSRRSSAR